MKSADSGGSPKLEWIRTVAGCVGSGMIQEHALRVARLVRDRNGTFRIFASSSRFVTGLSRSHPVENGFAWHHTLGAPYLPGSSVKGMVRAWARDVGEADRREARLDRLLGTRNRVGIVSLLDAVPIKPVELKADVMTPHYASWTKDDPPGDWCSPKPIPFLTMAEDARMLFGVVPCRRASTEDARTVMGWITDALTWQGAGAKTAVGYGRFELDETEAQSLVQRIEQAEQELREEQRRAAMNPVEREIEDVLANHPDKQSAASAAIYQEIADGRWTGRDRRQAIEWLKAEMVKDKTWRPEKKKPPKTHKRTVQVQQWLREG